MVSYRPSCYVFLILFCVGGATAYGADIIDDDFSGGIDLTIYTPIGGAVLSLDESDLANPKMKITMFNTGDGVRINIPDVRRRWGWKPA